MFCEKCGGELRQDKKLLVCQKCGAEYGLDYAEGYNATYSVGGEQVVPRGFSSKRNIIIIVIAALLVMGGIGVGIAVGVSNHPAQTALSGLQLAEKYLSEQNYDQAIIAFEQFLEIEPMNVDAYLGLADAYLGIGDKDKAIEVLRRGLEMTGDARIQAKLDELLNEDNSSEPEDNTKLKLSWTDLNGNIVYVKFGHYLKRDGELWRFCDENGDSVSDKKYKYVENFVGTDKANYSLVTTEEGRVFTVDKSYRELFEIDNPQKYTISDQTNPLVITWSMGTYGDNTDNQYLRIMTPDGRELFSWKENDAIDGSGKPESLDDPLYPAEVWDYDCDTEFHDDFSVDSITTVLDTANPVNIVDSLLYVNFVTEITFKYDDTAEKADFERRKQEALSHGGVFTWAHNSHGHYTNCYAAFKFSLDSGSLTREIDESYSEFAVSGHKFMTTPIKLGNGYSIVSCPDPTPNSRFALYIGDVRKSFVSESNLVGYPGGQDYYDVLHINFDYVNSFINDKLMLCAKYVDENQKQAEFALFKINWQDENSEEQVNGSGILNDGHERISDFYDHFSYSDNDLALGYALVGKDEKWGYISTATGKELAMFDDASNFSNGYAIVTINGKGHIIDSDFNAVSDEFLCDSASAIGDGSFRVSVGDMVKRLVIEK